VPNVACVRLWNAQILIAPKTTKTKTKNNKKKPHKTNKKIIIKKIKRYSTGTPPKNRCSIRN
jgi:hypothetical protein